MLFKGKLISMRYIDFAITHLDIYNYLLDYKRIDSKRNLNNDCY